MNTETPGKQLFFKSRYFLPLLMAALWNIIFGGLILFNLERADTLLFIKSTPLSDIFNAKIFWLAVIVAGFGYGLVAFAHNKGRFFISIGGILKVVVFIVLAYLWLDSSVTTLLLLAGVGDLLWAIYFFWFLAQTKEYGYV
jgi:hypothetical protein